MTEHTKEPWAILDGKYTTRHGTVPIYATVPTVGAAPDRWLVARAENHATTNKGTANARRIAACVNALAGIPTADLEKVAEAKEHYPRMVRLAAAVERYISDNHT